MSNIADNNNNQISYFSNSASKINTVFASSRLAYLFVFIAGALLPLAFSPLNYYFLAFLSPAVLFYSLLTANPKRAALLSWWFGLGYFGVGISWVYVAIYVFGLSSVITSVFFTLISINVIAAFLALQGYLSVLFISKLHITNRSIILLIVFPLFWVLSEWFRGWFLTGFPWLSVGYSQVHSLLAGYAPVAGVFGVSGITVFFSSLLLLLSLSLFNKKFNTSITAVVLIILVWVSGYALTQKDWTEVVSKPLKVSLVQGNVEQMNKWDPDHFDKRKQTYLSLTEKNWGSDLILWPENSLTIFQHQLQKSVIAPLAAEAKKNNTDIIFGLPTLNQETDEYFSSLMALSAEHGQQFYHKNHLVPFGEYLPLDSLLRGLVNFFNLPMSDFTPGDYEQNLFLAAGQKIAPTICYEDAFGEDLIRFLPEATLLLNASNNAWYGDSFAPHQHLQISQMRALETGRDMMRVTTNGVSALIDFKGNIISRSPQFESYVVTGLVQPRLGKTPYVAMGNAPLISMMILVLVLIVFLNKFKYFRC